MGLSARVIATLERAEELGEHRWQRVRPPLGETHLLYRCNKHGVEWAAAESSCAECHVPPKRPPDVEVPDFWVKANGYEFDPCAAGACVQAGLVMVIHCADDRLVCTQHPLEGDFASDEMCKRCWAELLDEEYEETGVLTEEMLAE